MKRKYLKIENEETDSDIKSLKNMIDSAIRYTDEIRYKKTKTRKPLPQRIMLDFHFLEEQLHEIQEKVIGMEAIEKEKDMIHLNREQLNNLINQRLDEMIIKDEEISRLLAEKRAAKKKSY